MNETAARLRLAEQDVDAAQNEWPDPQPLEPELLPVAKFEPEFLPEASRAWIKDVAERKQVPIDLPAAASVLALAGATGRRAVIYPKKNDSWGVTPNLYGGVVAQPGLLKTPVIEEIVRPLVKTQGLWREEHESELAHYKAKQKAEKLKEQASSEQFKVAYKKDPKAAPPSFERDEDDAPVARRLIVEDATVEKLHEILRDNPAGVLCIHDELHGWLASFDKPGREADRDFYLKAWDGNQPHSVDRITRGSIHVPHVCISLLGGIQPARLRAFLHDPLAGGASDDGLLQRLQFFVWPDPKRDYTHTDRKPNTDAEIKFANVLDKMLSLSCEFPAHLRFSAEAQLAFDVWLTDLETRVIRQDSGMHPALVNHLAKYRSLLPTLAGLFELADQAATGRALDTELIISSDHFLQAHGLCRYLETHARRVIGCLVSKAMFATRELHRHLMAGELKETFSTRDVYRRGWTSLATTDEAREALRLLADSGWIRELQPDCNHASGRPTEMWITNPKAPVKR